MMELRLLTGKENTEDSIFDSPDAKNLVKMYQDFYPTIGFNPPWVGYLIIKNNKVVGSCGFVGKPFDGQVELAYWTFKEFEGQGIASFACKGLIEIAQKEDPLVSLTAKTAPEENASTRILEKHGFEYSKVVQDEEIGDAWLWILK
ncbi:GNAT family N-acetyltransferase [Algoriphagus lutimaris]|uniref:GNAT family N-acetyltransferase n=1 Tax=Algoriphagus lutimaris TaxID=613197 RepID=UPI00196B13B4|nr:GNAT family N-acetyltransferase [Algoriphagus lutimaris]MBN3519768.1 GNAT family N-acetyltransferase [Algoriphagus lutimaris]